MSATLLGLAITVIAEGLKAMHDNGMPAKVVAHNLTDSYKTYNNAHINDGWTEEGVCSSGEICFSRNYLLGQGKNLEGVAKAVCTYFDSQNGVKSTVSKTGKCITVKSNSTKIRNLAGLKVNTRVVICKNYNGIHVKYYSPTDEEFERVAALLKSPAGGIKSLIASHLRHEIPLNLNKAINNYLNEKS